MGVWNFQGLYRIILCPVPLNRRCDGYPNHPAFYELATELGIYVINEADIETHGAAETTGDMNYRIIIGAMRFLNPSGMNTTINNLLDLFQFVELNLIIYLKLLRWINRRRSNFFEKFLKSGH